MRILVDHIVPGDSVNHQLTIAVVDEPGAGGANHEYRIGDRDGDLASVSFQNGPIAEAGVNGVTHEALLAIVIDRLRSFQAGPFACRENALAITAAEEALFRLQSRTVNRLRRGVEGKNQL